MTYEEHLKRINPTIRNITYDVKDLNNYIDHLPDLSALVFNAAQQAYTPYHKGWIKSKVLTHLQKNAKK